jgi:hypothetical protein
MLFRLDHKPEASKIEAELPTTFFSVSFLSVVFSLAVSLSAEVSLDAVELSVVSVSLAVEAGSLTKASGSGVFASVYSIIKSMGTDTAFALI